MKKIAFVVQRYGEEVNGGAEQHCRQVAERLTDKFNVEVITTCAKDYYSWKNEYESGVCKLNKVTVHRFKVDYERNKKKFDQKSSEIFGIDHLLCDEDEWMKLQGPYSSELLDFIYYNKDRYHKFIFFTYLYATTYYGLPLVQNKAILVPTSHDEPPIYLDIFEKFFHMPSDIFYNTPEEKKFITKKFTNSHIKNLIVGIGFDIPKNVDAKRFRKKYGIREKFILYVGRIDESKGCKQLFDYFIRYKKLNKGNLSLILMGKEEMKIPKHKSIISLGFVSDLDKYDGMAAAQALINPSKYESFSMVLLEAMAVGTSVIVNGNCEVLKGHVERSGNGSIYTDYDDFVECLSRDINFNNKYINQFNWRNIIKKYCKAIGY
ncbi:MAG: glycosyltransferase family 4 protein [Candidatus Cloacimonetes bacterium]|nr:glycosyltransferase family 4 protein [Candidatus Cloacimonadota bacterium]